VISWLCVCLLAAVAGGMAQRVGDSLTVLGADGESRTQAGDSSEEEEGGIDYATARFHVFGGTGWR
jgi:hypothetical protein